MNTRNDISPTEYAAKMIAEGYSPEEVEKRMKAEKIAFPSILGVMNDLLAKKNMTIELVAGSAGIDPATIYRFMNKQRNPSRNALLRIALAMELTLDEAQVLLKSGNCAALSGSRHRDLEIMDGIIHKRDFDEVNKALEAKGFQSLEGRG